MAAVVGLSGWALASWPGVRSDLPVLVLFGHDRTRGRGTRITTGRETAMTAAVLVALAAAFLYALCDLVVVRLSRCGCSSATALVWIVGTGVVVMLPTALLLDGVPSQPGHLEAVGLAALGGLAYLACLWCMIRAVRVGMLAIVAPLFALEGAVAAVAAFALGERIERLAVLGMLAAAAGGIMASVASRSPHESGENLRVAEGAWWAIAGAMLGGLTILVYGWTVEISAVAAVSVSRVASLVAVVPVAFVHGGFRLPRRLIAWACLAGVLEAGAFLALATGMALGPASVVAVVTAQFATFGVILGVVFLKERPTRWQVAGVCVTVCAVTVLAGGSG